MGRVVQRNVIKRKLGHLYFVDGKGGVFETPMARGGKKRGKRKKVGSVVREEGYLYYLKGNDLYKAELKRQGRKSSKKATKKKVSKRSRASSRKKTSTRRTSKRRRRR